MKNSDYVSAKDKIILEMGQQIYDNHRYSKMNMSSNGLYYEDKEEKKYIFKNNKI